MVIICLLDILAKLFHACPNLETMHIGYGSYGVKSVDPPVFRRERDANFLKLIRFDHLTYLTFSTFDLSNGDFFEDVSHYILNFIFCSPVIDLVFNY